MTTPAQIETQLMTQDIIPYHNSVFDGFVPDSFVEQFKIAMMVIPVTAHQYPMKDVKRMISRRPNEVTNKELGMMINAIYSVPFGSMYQTIEEGIERTMEFDKIKEEYNKNSAAFERKINAKRQRLLSLSGVQNSVPLQNGMKIIPGKNKI